ncbi:MAG: 16S rRNA (adenine(1518)-N(6)/adenine(1519)-N(6))-dimethyltransferase RsmA [Bacteroidetes bacterium]|nr:16S rRNA (adenine(1518)-N(6)/adenine(1519)-N(6))-dimethyltransferase RsmA [Bacteroidota bacterium]
MQDKVRAKKHLGQHFLNDEAIAQNIVESLSIKGYSKVLEIGPGMGVLTKYLVKKPELDLSVIEIDRDSIAYIESHFPELKGKIISGDFLKFPLNEYFSEPFAIIGNFPYNISSQILFSILEHRDKIPEMVGMFQKEVAERIAAPPKNKTCGILSILIQAFYDVEYLFTVDEHVFTPPPRVKSAVLRIRRNSRFDDKLDSKLFFTVVKTGFNQRRKTLRNSLKPVLPIDTTEIEATGFLSKRAEELSVEDFMKLTELILKGRQL